MKLPALELDRLTDEQRSRLSDIWISICHRYPDDRDHVKQREAAYTAAFDYLCGDLEIQTAGLNLKKVRIPYGLTMAAVRQIAIMAVTDGLHEKWVASQLGVDRMTVRRWRHQEVK